MVKPRVVLAGIALVVLVVSLAPTSMAADGATYATYLLEGYTSEGRTNTTAVDLEGDQVLSAWFNFTILEDVVSSDPDSFQVRVTNRDDASITSIMPGTTDADGHLSLRLPFARTASPSWDVAVTCVEAGDRTLGPIVIERDDGNDWSCQVEYYYTVETNGPGNGGTNGGGEEDGGDDQPLIVTALQANLVVLALVSLLVAFLALQSFRGEGGLRYPMIASLFIAVDSFFSMPIAVLVNMEVNDTALGVGPYGPEWLGTLAIVLFAIWVVPFALARRRVLTSKEVYNLLSRVALEATAKWVRARGEGRREDPLSDSMYSLVLVCTGLASVVVVALMLLS